MGKNPGRTLHFQRKDLTKVSPCDTVEALTRVRSQACLLTDTNVRRTAAGTMGVLGAKAWEQVPIPRSENASGGIRPLPRVWPLRRAIVHVTEGGLQGFGLDGSRLSRAADIRRRSSNFRTSLSENPVKVWPSKRA